MTKLTTQNEFIARHIGPREADTAAMLELLGYASIDAKSGKASVLINDTWLGTGRVTIIQRDPLPISILAIIPQADIGGAL